MDDRATTIARQILALQNAVANAPSLDARVEAQARLDAFLATQSDVSPAVSTTPNKSGSSTLLIFAIVVIAFGAFFVLANQDDLLTGGSGVSSDRVTVAYILSGTASGALITYTDGSGNIQQVANGAVPNRMSFEVDHGAILVFSAQNTGDSGDLSCTITADGVTINSGRSSGAYAVVSCSGQVP